MDIIDNWKALPIGRYLEICREGQRKDIDDVERQARAIAILTGRHPEEILNLPLAEYRSLSERSAFLLKVPEHVGGRAAQVYRVGKWDLVPVSDPSKITVAQYVDFQQFCTDPRHIVELLSVLMVPRGHGYNQGYDIAEVQAEIREHMSVEEVLRVSGFFIMKFAGLIRDSLDFSVRAAQEMPGTEEERTRKTEEALKIRAAWNRLTGNGDGSPMSTRSARRAGAVGRRSGR